MDLSGDVEFCRQESLHEEGARAGSETVQEVGVVYQGIAQGRQATAGGNSGRGGGTPTDRGYPPPQKSLEEDEGLVV